jgi:hypothetical protein
MDHTGRHDEGRDPIDLQGAQFPVTLPSGPSLRADCPGVSLVRRIRSPETKDLQDSS